MFILIWRDILGKDISARRLSTRERREESERTTGAIVLHVQRESHHIDGVRAKSWVHFMPGRRAERAIKIRIALWLWATLHFLNAWNGLTLCACKRQSMEYFNQSNPIFGCLFQTWPELNVCLRGRVEAGFQVSRSCLCIVLCLTQIIHKVPCPRCSDMLHSKRFESSYYAKVGAFCSRLNTFPDELARKRLLRAQASVRKDGKNYTQKGLNCKVRKYNGYWFNPKLVFFHWKVLRET